LEIPSSGKLWDYESLQSRGMGRVSSRVALLLQATERKPAASLVEFGIFPLHLFVKAMSFSQRERDFLYFGSQKVYLFFAFLWK